MLSNKFLGIALAMLFSAQSFPVGYTGKATSAHECTCAFHACHCCGMKSPSGTCGNNTAKEESFVKNSNPVLENSSCDDPAKASSLPNIFRFFLLSDQSFLNQNDVYASLKCTDKTPFFDFMPAPPGPPPKISASI